MLWVRLHEDRYVIGNILLWISHLLTLSFRPDLESFYYTHTLPFTGSFIYIFNKLYGKCIVNHDNRSSMTTLAMKCRMELIFVCEECTDVEVGDSTQRDV